MKKVLALEDIAIVSKQLHDQKKRIVLVGGCFDILHAGHIRFLTEAKKQGDILFVLLESDEAAFHFKGQNRPIHTQEERVIVLNAITVIDYILPLSHLLKNNDYDALIRQIKPAIIATTKGDPNREHKERQAKQIDALVVDVIAPIPNLSTTRLANIIKEKFNL